MLLKRSFSASSAISRKTRIGRLPSPRRKSTASWRRISCARRSNTLILPEGITSPRLVLEADRLRLAFRYHIGRWSTVISVDMRVWLAAKVPNVIVLELQGMHAGSLPVSTQSLLDRLTDMADRNNIKVTWYRYKGSPVAVLQFQGEQPTTPVSLERLDLQPGTIQFQGHSEEQPTPVNTSGADPSRSAPP